jgi:protein-S-isoprenylcysteine O-methyltransferase Ste14
MSALHLIQICWAAFAIYWGVTALSAKPSAQRQSLAGRALHVAMLAVTIAALLGPWRPYPLNLAVVPRGRAADALAAALCVAGLTGALWARWALGDNWSSAVTLKQGHELIMRGPYRYVRHPIYSGLLVMVLGTALAIGRLHAFIGFAACVVGFWIKLRQEEALMTRSFPDAYASYQRRTKALVPFVW